MAKNKKRQHSRTVELKRQMEQEALANGKDRAKKRLDPAARALLYGDLIFLAVLSILDAWEVLSAFAGAAGTVTGVIVLLIALWLQFGNKNRRPGAGKGPRL